MRKQTRIALGTALGLLLMASLVYSANPTFNNFDSTQFGTDNNTVSIGLNAGVTNLNLLGDSTVEGTLECVGALEQWQLFNDGTGNLAQGNISWDADGNITAPSITLGNTTNVASFILTQTNFISGKVYTNLTGRPLQVTATAQLITAAVAGNAQLSLLISGYLTNTVNESTLGASPATTNTYFIGGIVPAGRTYSFTNTSSGTGDSATVLGGQTITF